MRIWRLADTPAPAGRGGFAAAAFLALTALFLFFYLPSLSGGYLFSDDYYWLPWGAHSTEIREQRYLSYTVGRPLYGLAFHLSAWVASWLGLTGLRVLLLALLAGACALFASWLVRLRFSRPTALALSAAIGTLPPFVSAAGYVSAGLHAGALMLGLGAAMLLFGAMERGLARGWKDYAPGCVLFVIAMAYHQIAAQIFWILPFTLVLFRPAGDRRHTAGFLAAGAACLVVYGLLFMGLTRLFAVPLHERIQPVPGVTAKWLWIFEAVLPRTLSLWRIPFDWGTAWAVGSWISLGLCLPLRPRDVASLVAMAFLSFVPCLVVSESEAHYRCLVVLQTMAVLLVFATVTRRFGTRSRLAATSAWIMACAGCLGCAITLSDQVIPIRKAEVRYLAKRLAPLGTAGGLTAVHLVVRETNANNPGPEFNTASSSQDWAIGGLARFAWRQTGWPDGNLWVMEISPPQSGPKDPETSVIDMNDFKWPPPKAARP
jgi:hypothetical protein